MIFTLKLLLHILILVISILLMVAFFTLIERKIMGSVQRRKGPNVVGVFGLLQPLADGLKLLVKEPIVPGVANNYLFNLAPCATFVLALSAWAVIPFGKGVVLANIQLGMLYLLACSSLGIYGVLVAGWASNSKYPFLGAIRSAAQMLSYELTIGFILVSIVLCAGSLNLTTIVEVQGEGVWFWKPLFLLLPLFGISILAETNRHPFDLPEAEAELVSGYNTEYSGMLFALFFLGEYANMLLMSVLGVLLFFGGWYSPFDFAPFNLLPSSFWLFFKTSFFLVFFIYARALLPRFRYDQLMRLGWKIFLPFSFFHVVFIVCFLFFFDALPPVKTVF